jgi:hypothetical protein
MPSSHGGETSVLLIYSMGYPLRFMRMTPEGDHYKVGAGLQRRQQSYDVRCVPSLDLAPGL